jgi:hypothetical protein
MATNLYLRPYTPLIYPPNIPLAGHSSSERNGTSSTKRFVQQKDAREGNTKIEVSDNLFGNDILRNQLKRNYRTFLCNDYYFSVASRCFRFDCQRGYGILSGHLHDFPVYLQEDIFTEP